VRALVTGGAGFIGSHLVDALEQEGHVVSIIDDLSTGTRDNLNPRASFYEVDLRSEDIRGVFEKERPEIVYHLGAQMNVTLSLRKPVFDADVNVIGTVNILQHCVDWGVKKFVFASTAGAIYGNPKDLPTTEATPAAPVSHYGTSKLSCEHYAALYQRIYDLPYTILRYANVYGPRQLPHGEAGVCAILAGLMLEGKTPVLYGHGEPVRDYVYVADVVRANLLAMDKAEGETLNIATGVPTTVNAIFEVIKDLTQFQGKPQLEPLRTGEVHSIYTDASRAEKALGWKPETTLAGGLKATVDHFRS